MHGPKGEDVSLGLDILFMLGLKHSLELVLERILSHHWGPGISTDCHVLSNSANTAPCHSEPTAATDLHAGGQPIESAVQSALVL